MDPMGYVFLTARSKVACAEAAELLEGARRRGRWHWWPVACLGGWRCRKGSQVPLDRGLTSKVLV